MKHSLTIALLGALAVAPSAFAAEDWSVVERPHFAIVGGYALAEPTGDLATIDGTRAEVDGGGTPTLSASWFLNDRFAIEAWAAAEPVGHRVRTDEGFKAGSVDAQPYAVSAQWHFGEPVTAIRPFVGLGYFETNYDDETIVDDEFFGAERFGVETDSGLMATVGADFNISPHWFARADVRYLHGGDGASFDAENEVNPVVAGIGIGARF